MTGGSATGSGGGGGSGRGVGLSHPPGTRCDGASSAAAGEVSPAHRINPAIAAGTAARHALRNFIITIIRKRQISPNIPGVTSHRL
jgi:hypothetical protein